MRLAYLPFLVCLALLLIAVLLPSQRDAGVAGWWIRVRYQIDFGARALLALLCIGAFVWYVLLPMLGWRPAGR